MLPASPVDRQARPARPRRALLALLAPPLLGAALLSACSLDWAVRADPGAGDASLAEGGGSADGADAPVGADAADTSVPGDAPVSPDAAACAALLDGLAPKRKKARDCQIGTAGQCTTTVDDECGCKVIVTFPGVANTNDYAAAVGDLLAKCGKPPCTAACPQLNLPSSWACLGSSGGFSCTP